MQSITQQHTLGCGAACMAFVLGRPYAEIIYLLGAEQAAEYGFWCRDLVATLGQYGRAYTCKYARGNPAYLPGGTIVFLKRSPLYPAGHYLAKYGGTWMDPWINFGQSRNLQCAQSGFRAQLPYHPSYAIIPVAYDY